MAFQSELHLQMKRLTERFPEVLQLPSLSHLFHWAWEAQPTWGCLQKRSGAGVLYPAHSDLDLSLRVQHSEQFISHMAKIHTGQCLLAEVDSSKVRSECGKDH